MKRVPGVSEIERAIFNIFRIISDKILDESCVVSGLSKFCKNIKHSMNWLVLRNTWATVKGHVLFLSQIGDLLQISYKHKIQIEFIVMEASYYNQIFSNYTSTVIVSDDNTRDFRFQLQKEFDLQYLGLFFVLYCNPPQYNLLNEWLVNDISSLNTVRYNSLLDHPNVIVFDMDSTLITDEDNVNIRDDAVYDSLNDLRSRNCLLCLWSYGDREHVIYSLKKLNLYHYFYLILAEGNEGGVYKQDVHLDREYDVLYKNTPFYLNVDRVYIPKSPRVVLWHLKQKGINFIKSITLVDDKKNNDYNYDYFVNVSECPTPIDDWEYWHTQIVKNLSNRCVPVCD
uniref:PlxyGVORF70 protein n=1 Tax=Plutella xylostella granulovirus TaxID=98383 RepID=A0A1B2CSH6_9BBAC|nr:PlxyGVORF70 protein [Plutella xylostella granulovirus]